MGFNTFTMGKMAIAGFTGNYPEGTMINLQNIDARGNPIGGKVSIPADEYTKARTVTREGVKRTSITTKEANDLADKVEAMKDFEAGDLTLKELDSLGRDAKEIAKNIQESKFTKEQERRAKEITSQDQLVMKHLPYKVMMKLLKKEIKERKY